jgi:hypothetical protein
MKILMFTLFLILSNVAFAQSVDDRLIELIQKKAQLQGIGKDLDAKDADEFNKLAGAKGVIGTAELQQQNKAQLATPVASPTSPSVQTPPSLQAALLTPGASQPERDAQTKAYTDYQSKHAKTSDSSVIAPVNKSMVKLKDSNQRQNAVTATSTQAPSSAASAGGPGELAEQRNLGAESVNSVRNQPVLAKTLPKKREITEPIDPGYRSRMKKEMTSISDARKGYQEEKALHAAPVSSSPTVKPGAIYDPVPSDPGVKQNGFVVDRDSTTIITKRVGTKDAVTIKMCIAYGVSIILDDSIDTELQRVILDDKVFFDALEFENHRGVYARLVKPIPEGSRWESAIRLVRKSDDRTYLVNLVGVSCPEGVVEYPKVVYLKEKYDVLAAKQNDINTPEDMIIEVSQGLPRKNLHDVQVYDMVASPGADSVLFGIEIQNAQISKPEKIEFAALDNLQINKISTKTTYMKLQSDKSTELRGSQSYRFKVMMGVDKSYILKNRYVHLVYINKETKHYQYIQIDVMKYFKSLKDRGFDL